MFLTGLVLTGTYISCCTNSLLYCYFLTTALLFSYHLLLFSYELVLYCTVFVLLNSSFLFMFFFRTELVLPVLFFFRTELVLYLCCFFRAELVLTVLFFSYCTRPYWSVFFVLYSSLLSCFFRTELVLTRPGNLTTVGRRQLKPSRRKGSR